jgi:L-ascorbate metabolism protein UlaG (beta-lactamase superfamily)
MEIKYLGHACFLLKGEHATVVIDPYEEKVGLKLPSLTADMVAVTHDHYDHNNVKAISGNPFVINGPGEYEVKGVFVNGLPTFHDEKGGKERGINTVYLIEIDGFRVCHLGDLGHKLESEQLDLINGVDVLLVPVGGQVTLDGKKAAEVADQIEPRIVVPMHYQTKGLKISGLAEVTSFLQEIGVKEPVKKDTLKLKKDQLPQDKTEVIALKAGA